MQDLQEVTQEVHYENFRGDRLSCTGERKKIRSVSIPHYQTLFSMNDLFAKNWNWFAQNTNNNWS